jgi:uncharacterized protein (TIGR02453 family)
MIALETSIILKYLTDLEDHNEQEWYHANKKQYQEANIEFEKLVYQLICEIGKTDTSILHNDPKKLTFKLIRDTRFSHDKSPYNPSFRVHISSEGKLPIPVGYYLMIKPGNRSFLGGGLFTDIFKDATTMVRNYLAEHGSEFETMISEERFKACFVVKGESLKKVPFGYNATLPQAEFLKNKSWYLEYPISDELILNPDLFVKTAVEKFNVMKPFNDYLNKALIGFQMPKR